MRALFLNNYSIASCHQRASQDVDHFAHSWGYDYFLQNSEASVAEISPRALAWQNSLRTYLLLGDLKQQFDVLRRRREIDVVVAANMSVVGALCYLKKWLRLPPIVAVLHSIRHYQGTLGKTALRQRLMAVERIICLARKDVCYLRDELHLPAERICYIPWSANVSDYDRAVTKPKVPNAPPYIMSMGLSDRDHETLIEAFESAALDGWQLRIYAGGRFHRPQASRPNILVNEDWVCFKDSVGLYRAAQFVVVPLVKTERTLGLTSLLDAMATGKAVIMTQNPGVDIDIEKEKIGFWAPPADSQALAQKMRYLYEHPEVARECGTNGRRYLEETYNYGMFCQQLFAAAKSVAR